LTKRKIWGDKRLKYEFDSEIRLLEGKMKWNVLYFPYPVQEVFQTNGKVAVRITVDGHEFDHTLLPSRNGHYLVYNEFIRRAVQKKPGDIVRVTLEKSEEKREIVVPVYISGALEAGNVLDVFLRQPDYVKREQINYIELAKKQETKDSRLLALVKRIKEQAG
jgi:hypothetical protein